MNRRSFLTGLAGILAAGAAPAIVRASSIMAVQQPIPREFRAWEWREAESGLLESGSALDAVAKRMGLNIDLAYDPATREFTASNIQWTEQADGRSLIVAEAWR